ncbi:hypothetical protein DdX_03594 [Ditylenchus destructor]|uniref:Uncharacterized protein n=1 Tax=Ditylenchus destructor TaxID=166010 RepID=A0AAD4NFL3_9BILA|nr:hypothetical protein DdX_03594 [Ditylenchus destructor]
MSESIGNCASSTASERRERRRQKILGNAPGRLSAILSGPDGKEDRQAPILEGMHCGDSASSTDADGCSSENRAHKSDSRGKISTFETEIDYVEPVYCELVSRNRLFIALVLGILFRIAVALQWTNHLTLSFAVIFLSYEMFFALPHKSLKYPKHGYVVNFLMVAGLNEQFVIYLGLFLDLLWEFFVDFTIIAFSYICLQVVVNCAQNLT